MDLEQAKNQFNKILEEVKNKKLNTQESDKFLFEFIELMEKHKLSSGNIALFASIVATYIFTKPKVETIKQVLPLVQIYLQLIENPDTESVYDTRGILTF